MKKFYLAGQNNFGNRGCEALVRSTVDLLSKEFGQIKTYIPSYRQDLDSAQWPNANDKNCKFVSAASYPLELKIWNKYRKILRIEDPKIIPTYKLSENIKNDIALCDAMISIGGDNITLDYDVDSLVWHVRFAEHAKKMGKKTILWGASIGPFSNKPNIEKFAANFLRSLDLITVRETISLNYLRSIGVSNNVQLVSDGAFALEKESINYKKFWPSDIGDGVVGINVSPLIQKYRTTDDSKDKLKLEVSSFIQSLLKNTNKSVILIPHVDPLDGTIENSDSSYMQEILKKCGGTNPRLSIAPRNLNACQLKYIISLCRYFIGARTHATIASLSSKIPTISIAYSTKAKGLNYDLFGNYEYVLETPHVSKDSLEEYYQKLELQETSIINTLDEKIPIWQKNSSVTAKIIKEMLNA